MSETKEMQDEEREALTSIYEGDEHFKQINPTTFQYKYGETDTIKSFQLEISWSENYPNEVPNINMDVFYNRNLPGEIKEKIKTILLEEAEQWMGCGMTYTLFECLKDKIDEILENVTEILASVEVATKSVDNLDLNKESSGVGKEAKKEQLTKSQKRRLWAKTDHTGAKPRGWDWVDLVKHLSQTGGSKQEDTTMPIFS